MDWFGSIQKWAARATLALAALGLSSGAALAVPAFAVQTGQHCVACHIGGFGPQLTPFGRDFKLHGYTARAGGFTIPVSAAVIASYVRTNKDQPAPPPKDFAVNNNVAVDQVNLFIAGGIGDHFGGFAQYTYNGVSHTYSWDNMDLRAVTEATIKGHDMVLGLSVNNAPTVQDAFNTLAGWGFLYTSSALAPAPANSPIIGSLAGSTLGVTSYAWISRQIYIEGGGYQSPGTNFLYRAGVDPTDPGNIKGTAPYGRIAYDKNWGDRNMEVGAFAMAADIYPGHVENMGLTDHYTDIGVDGSYQYFRGNKDVLTFNARYTHEGQRLDASNALGLAANAHDALNELRADASYYWRDKVGLTVAGFDTWGSQDTLLYSGNRTLRPDSSGVILQIDGTPWGNGSPLGSAFNLRVGVQYTAYFRFNGANQNWDGLNIGHNAADNNTLRVFTWIAY